MARRDPFRDPTIPTSRQAVRQGGNAAERGVTLGPTTGRLVDYGDRVVLVDAKGNDWSQDRVRWVGGAFGFSSEGLEKPPRAWKYDTAGEPIIEGDMFVIDFLNGDPEQPFIRGGVRSLKPADTDYNASQPIGLDPNGLRWRLLQLDPVAGTQLRFVDIEIDPDTGKVEIRAGGASTAVSAVRVELDPILGTCKIGQGQESQRVLLGDKILQDLIDLGTELITVAGVVPTVAPTTTALVAGWTADLANPIGNTSLSGTLKTQ